MKKHEVQAIIDSGRPVIVAEYRGGHGEVIRWKSKDTQKMEEARVCTHALETACGEQFKISERLADGADVVNVKLPAKRGDHVLVILRSWHVEKGNVQARGEIWVIEEG